MGKYSVIIGGVVSACLLSCSPKQPDLYQTIKDMNELQLTEFSLTKTVTIRDAYDEDLENEDGNGDFLSYVRRLSHAAEKKLKKGNRVGVYGISKDYKVSMDLSRLSPDDIDASGDHITLSLPDVTITPLGDNLQPEIYHERVSAWRSDITLAEREQIMRKGSKKLEEEFKASSDSIYASIRNQARTKAKSWFYTILKDWGYNHIEIRIK